MNTQVTQHVSGPARGSVGEVFRAFLRLGLTSFGGPIAHLGYFRSEFVERRRWLDEHAYADVIALCQFLPGPASSQVGMTLGIMRAGLPGAAAAWIGFTLPSAIALILFAFGIGWLGDLSHAPWLHGLKIVAVAVVGQAVWGMARTLCPDRARASMAALAAVLVLAVPTAYSQIAVIAIGGLAGWRFLPGAQARGELPIVVPFGKRTGIAALLAFALLLALLPALAAASGNHALALFDSFYRSGALVFGGGHVVLPLLQKEVVPTGWITNDLFLAGYGAAQAIPGPLFTFAAYLGAIMQPAPTGWAGGLLCLAAIFLPSFLLLAGALPFWEGLRQRPAVPAALSGINAVVVGLLLAALYTPVWTSAIFAPQDFAIGVGAFVLLVFWRVPPWLVVVLGAVSAYAMAVIF